MGDLERLFAAPPAAYRGKPFWAWNGKLEPDELRRQIRILHRMGFGGFFMHSRVGLATEYLGEDWFDVTGACIDEAEKLGMEAWLYDEDRWPSGAAGGLVTKDVQYRQRSLILLTPASAADLPADVAPTAVFTAEVDGHNARNVRRHDAIPDGVPDGTTILTFHVQVCPESPWYNGATYLDTLNHEAVARFIEVTHEAYRERIAEKFGHSVPGIFTDEPNYGMNLSNGWPLNRQEPGVAWTERLPDAFAERYGYDLTDRLPELFFRVDDEDVSQARWHYYDCITHLFTDAFARQVGEWCERNGMAHTGHVLFENTLAEQAHAVGAAMRFYEHMQTPGIDVLTEGTPYEYSTAKQCASVLRQTGRRWMLSEMYGCTGWDFSFEGHKAAGDWQAALGVNLRAHHLSWYTMRGQAKRDYPASIHYQSPWWTLYPKVEDYFARVGAVMTQGEPVRRLLVLHPVETVWSQFHVDPEADAGVQLAEKQYGEVRDWLLEAHIDFDYGDEEMISRLGRVEGARFRLGEATYDAVLVPPMRTIRSTTLAALGGLVGAGGALIVCGEKPTHVDALPAAGDALAALDGAEWIAYGREALVASAGQVARTVHVCDADGIEHADVLYQHRSAGSTNYLFLCNVNRKQPTGPLTVTVRGRGQVQIWDAESGERRVLASSDDAPEGCVEFPTDMPASGSRLFVIGDEDTALAPHAAFVQERRQELSGEGWQTQLTEPNVLVLDVARYRLDGGEWQEPAEILRIDQAVRNHAGLPLRSGNMVQPWAREKNAGGPSVDVELMFLVDVQSRPTGGLTLALEDPARFVVTLNGHVVPGEADSGWWVDPALRTFPLDSALLVAGRNEIMLRGVYDEAAGLEAMFLLGTFGVELEGPRAQIVDLPQVTFGDWTQQGLPFYGGSVVFRRQVAVEPQADERVFVEVPQFSGACARVFVNGSVAGVIGWEPHEVDVTDLVRGSSTCEIGVEIVTHRRNTFGPLHLDERWPSWTGPFSFLSDDDHWQDEYNIVPCGCRALPRISYRRFE